MKMKIVSLAFLFSIHSLSYSQVLPDDRIASLLKADQSVRNSGNRPEDKARISDLSRRNEVKQLIQRDEFLNPNSYADAGVIMHHSGDVGDIIMARELFILSAYSRGQYSSLTALAEDRLLIKIGRLQRFGSQYSIKKQIKLEREVELGDWSVTDDLRADYLLPPIKSITELGVKAATEKYLPVNMQKASKMFTPTGWNNDSAQSTVHNELVDLLGRLRVLGKSQKILANALKLYQEKNTWMPSDYCLMAELLTEIATEPSQLLLANELAALSVMRMHKPGWRVFAISWDRFAQSIGLSSRYGTNGTKVEPSIVPKVLKLINES